MKTRKRMLRKNAAQITNGSGRAARGAPSRASDPSSSDNGGRNTTQNCFLRYVPWEETEQHKLFYTTCTFPQGGEPDIYGMHTIVVEHVPLMLGFESDGGFMSRACANAGRLRIQTGPPRSFQAMNRSGQITHTEFVEVECFTVGYATATMKFYIDDSDARAHVLLGKNQLKQIRFWHKGLVGRGNKAGPKSSAAINEAGYRSIRKIVPEDFADVVPSFRVAANADPVVVALREGRTNDELKAEVGHDASRQRHWLESYRAEAAGQPPPEFEDPSDSDGGYSSASSSDGDSGWDNDGSCPGCGEIDTCLCDPEADKLARSNNVNVNGDGVNRSRITRNASRQNKPTHSNDAERNDDAECDEDDAECYDGAECYDQGEDDSEPEYDGGDDGEMKEEK